MDTPELRLICERCNTSITPGKGYLWVDYAHINQYNAEMKAWQNAHPKPENGGYRITTFGEIRKLPERIRWHAHHAACDPDPDAGAYTIDADRLQSWADLANWTAQLMGLKWFLNTNWQEVLRGVATSNGALLRPTAPSPLNA